MANLNSYINISANIVGAIGNISGDYLFANNVGNPANLEVQSGNTYWYFNPDNSFTGNGNITTGNITINGNIFYNPVYGQFYSNVTQTSTTSTPTQVTLTSTNGNNQVEFNTNGNITINHGGVYAINAILQIGKGGGAAANAYVWFRHNGVDVPNSNFNQIVDKASEQIATAVFIENVNAGDNVSVMWAQTDSVTLTAVGANADGITQPAVPSVYISVVPVGA